MRCLPILILLAIGTGTVRAQRRTNFDDVLKPLFLDDLSGFKKTLKEWERSESNDEVKKQGYDILLGNATCKASLYEDVTIPSSDNFFYGGFMMVAGAVFSYLAYRNLYSTRDISRSITLGGGGGIMFITGGVFAFQQDYVTSAYLQSLRRKACMMKSYLAYRVQKYNDRQKKD